MKLELDKEACASSGVRVTTINEFIIGHGMISRISKMLTRFVFVKGGTKHGRKSF